jgi:hypothetical protein
MYVSVADLFCFAGNIYVLVAECCLLLLLTYAFLLLTAVFCDHKCIIRLLTAVFSDHKCMSVADCCLL